MKRNSLYSLLADFIKHQPEAKPLQAWDHFVSLARAGFVPAIVSVSEDGNSIEIIPDHERTRTKTVSRIAFVRNFQLVRKEVSERNSVFS